MTDRVNHSEVTDNPRKRKRNGGKRENYKKMRLSSHAMGESCSCTRLQCFENISMQTRQFILDKFNGLATKDQQFLRIPQTASNLCRPHEVELVSLTCETLLHILSFNTQPWLRQDPHQAFGSSLTARNTLFNSHYIQAILNNTKRITLYKLFPLNRYRPFRTEQRSFLQSALLHTCLGHTAMLSGVQAPMPVTAVLENPSNCPQPLRSS